mgnify:CR=1 FL=1
MGVALPETGLRARLPSSLGLLPWALETRASLCVPRLHEPNRTSGARHVRNASKRVKRLNRSHAQQGAVSDGSHYRPLPFRNLRAGPEEG